jgi:hypothetical protein
VFPERLARERIRRLSTPTPDSTVPVAERHVDAYRTRLEQVVPEAEARWESIDPSDLPEFTEFTHDDIKEARRFLDSLDSASRTSGTVEEAMWRVRQATGALAYARIRDGSFDAEELYAAARGTLETFESLDVDHACVDPGRYLPYGRRIDQQRWWGRREADAVVPGGSVRSGADRSTPQGRAELAGQHAMARARLLNVRQYRAIARDRPLGSGEPAGDRTSYADALARNVGTLRSDVAPLVNQFEAFEAEHDSYPDAFANGLWGRGMRGRNDCAEAAARTDAGYPGFGAAKVAAGVVHVTAFADALATLDPASPPTLRQVLEKKRSARRALRDRLDADPSPFVRDHLRHATAAVESGDLTLRYVDRHDDASAVRSHTEAWVDYHAALVATERAPAVATVLTRR